MLKVAKMLGKFDFHGTNHIKRLTHWINHNEIDSLKTIRAVKQSLFPCFIANKDEDDFSPNFDSTLVSFTKINQFLDSNFPEPVLLKALIVHLGSY